MSAEQQAGVKRRSSRAAREGKRRRRNAARTTATPSVQEATQAAATAASEATETPAETPASRAEARRLAKAQSAKAGKRRGIISSERTEGLRRFWRETMAEIRKVVWPDRETTRSLTLLVIALSVVLGIVLGGIDWVLFQIFEAL